MFDSITITGYKGVAAEYDLPPLVAFVGDMTSGKSAVLESIMLATLGEIPGVKESDFVEAISGPLTVQVTGDYGTGTFHVPYDSTPRIRKAAHDPSGLVYPGRDILCTTALADLANGGTALEAAIMRKFGTGELVLPEEVADTVAENWEDAVGGGIPVFAAAGAGAFLRWAKARIGALGREIKAAERNALAVAPVVSESAELRKVETALKRIEAAVEKYGDKWAKAFVTPAHIEKMKVAKAREMAHEKKAQSLTAALAVQEALLQAARAALDVGDETFPCPLCGAGDVDAKAAKAKHTKQVAILKTKVQTERAAYAKAKRDRLAVIADATPDREGLLEKYRQLSGAKQGQDRQADYQREAIALKKLQRDVQDAAQAVKIAFDASRQAALTKASMRIDDLSFPGFQLAINAKGPQWVVQTDAGPKWGSLSGGQKRSVMLAAPLVFANPEVPPVVLLDDDDFRGFSAKGVRQLLAKYATMQEEGTVAQVIITHHDDRVNEIPKSYKIEEV